MKPEQRKQRDLKIGAAAFGAGVLIAMGAITAATSGDAVTTSEPPTGPTDSASTSTSTTPPSTPETSKASPDGDRQHVRGIVAGDVDGRTAVISGQESA